MAETKAPPNSNKLAMSRALGAAFLNHQVEQLEKSVSSNAAASGNWRDRRLSPANLPRTGTNGPPKSPNRNKKGGDVQPAPKPKDSRNSQQRHVSAEVSPKRPSNESVKDADVVIVDASVLVHGLDNIKMWGRNNRAEVVIVPLEALNTLDLLKKGSTPLAQRARAASRVLEAQVGANPRIRVQRDDAFVLWDQIGFTSAGTDPDDKSSPEWVRRTICCARWEVDNARAEAPKVVLAVCTGHPSLSPQAHTLKLSADPDSSPLTPVPLPAPASVHANKHEPRSTGSLVAHWAARAGIPTLDVKPTPQGAGGPHPRTSSDEDHKRSIKGRRPPQSGPGDGKGLVERSPAVLAMMEVVSQPSKVVRVLARGEKLDPDP